MNAGSPAGRRHVVSAGLVIALALGLRLLAAAQTDSLWRDEANDVFLARGSHGIQELLSNIRVEGSPPLFYAAYPLHRAFPDTIWPARLLSVAFGSAAVAATIATGWLAFGPWAGIGGGVVMATSPFFIRYSLELRGYPLYQLTAALFGLAAVNLLRRRSWPHAVLAGGAGGVLLLTHYYSVFLVATALAILLVRMRPGRMALVGLSGIVTAVVFAPWLPGLVSQLGAPLRPWHSPNRKGIDMVQALYQPLGAWSIGLTLLLLVVGAAWLRHGLRAAAEPAMRARAAAQENAWILLVVGSLAANVLAWLVQLNEAIKAMLTPQYVMAMGVWLVPPIGLGLAALAAAPAAVLPGLGRSSRLRRMAFAAALISIGISQAVALPTWLGPRSPTPQLAQIVQQHGRPNDLILVLFAPHASTFNFYYGGSLEEWAFPFTDRVTNIQWDELSRRLDDPGRRDRFLRDLEGALDAGRRVWLFSSGTPDFASREYAWSPPRTRMRTAYERIDFANRQAFLRLLYTRAQPVPFDAPILRYWEPATLILFDPATKPPADHVAGLRGSGGH